MGITDFRSWVWGLRKTKKVKFWTEEVPSNVSSLAIDMNGLIHRSLSMVYGYGDYKSDYRKKQVSRLKYPDILTDIINTIEHFLKLAIKEIKPKHTLIIAVDGVAPIAKLQQQRQRRFISAQLRNKDDFDTAAITPGTKLMADIDFLIVELLKKEAINLPPNIIYSSYLTPGEGEHKIMNYYREMAKNDSGNLGSHVLYGLDADLIMLTLISPLDSIYLKSETDINLLNIDKFKIWISDFSGDKKLKESAIEDFVAMMFLLGNDFIPHGPTHHSMGDIINSLLESRKKIGKPLTFSGSDEVTKIDFRAMSEVVKLASKDQKDSLEKEAVEQINEVNSNPRRGKKIKNNIFVPYKINKMEMEEYSNMPVTQNFPDPLFPASVNNDDGEPFFDQTIFKSLWYSNEFKGNLNIKKLEKAVVNMCSKYIEGMAWCFTYYQTKNIDKKWFYPYFHAPLFEDLAIVMENVEAKNFISLDDYGYGYFEQLLSVVSAKSIDIFPTELQPLVKETNSPIFDMYPVSIEVEMAGVSIPNLGTVLVSKIYMERVTAALESLNLKDEGRDFRPDLIIDNKQNKKKYLEKLEDISSSENRALLKKPLGKKSQNPNGGKSWPQKEKRIIKKIF